MKKRNWKALPKAKQTVNTRWQLPSEHSQLVDVVSELLFSRTENAVQAMSVLECARFALGQYAHVKRYHPDQLAVIVTDFNRKVKK